MFAQKIFKNSIANFSTMSAYALKRTNTYYSDPSFVLERDYKMKINNLILNVQESVCPVDVHYINFSIEDNKMTKKSILWKNEVQNEYWYRYINKYYNEETDLKPHGVINQKKYYDVSEFKYNIDKLFYNLK